MKVTKSNAEEVRKYAECLRELNQVLKKMPAELRKNLALERFRWKFSKELEALDEALRKYDDARVEDWILPGTYWKGTPEIASAGFFGLTYVHVVNFEGPKKTILYESVSFSNSYGRAEARVDGPNRGVGKAPAGGYKKMSSREFMRAAEEGDVKKIRSGEYWDAVAEARRASESVEIAMKLDEAEY